MVKTPRFTRGWFFVLCRLAVPGDYIMPPMPPIPPAGIAGSSFGISATVASVVSSIALALAAFCSADLVTLTGSTIPASIMSTYSSLAALKPTPALLEMTFATTTLPSKPAFSAI